MHILRTVSRVAIIHAELNLYKVYILEEHTGILGTSSTSMQDDRNAAPCLSHSKEGAARDGGKRE